MMQEWASGGSLNYGLMLNSDSDAGAGSYRLFGERENSEIFKRPALEVKYVVTSP